MDNTELNRCFVDAGQRYGFNNVKAEFVPYRDFKIRWIRNYSWADFEISDYLRDAPVHVMEQIAESVFRKIKGEDSTIFQHDVCEWFTSEDFLRSNQDLFVSRYPGIGKGDEGKVWNLYESYSRLVTAGLIHPDPDVVISWSRCGEGRKAGRASVLMKVAVMSGSLDTDKIDEKLLDYCVYSTICHIQMGFDPLTESRAKEYDELLSRYPDRDEMESELRMMGMYVVRGVPHALTRRFIVRRDAGLGALTCAGGMFRVPRCLLVTATTARRVLPRVPK